MASRIIYDGHFCGGVAYRYQIWNGNPSHDVHVCRIGNKDVFGMYLDLDLWENVDLNLDLVEDVEYSVDVYLVEHTVDVE